MAHKNQSGKLGLGLRSETETLLGFGGLGISISIGTYTLCHALSDHESFIAAIGLMSISLLAGAYKKEVKKEIKQDRIIRHKSLNVEIIKSQ